MGALYYLPNARTEAQRQDMMELEAADICFLCPQHLGLRNDGNVVLWRSSTWTISRSKYAYNGSKHHLMLVPRQHISSLLACDGPTEQGYFRALRVAAMHAGIKSSDDPFGHFSRNGNPAYTGATVRHLHLHLAVADTKDPGAPPLVAYLSSRPQ
jgi:diadenosine tetraphosphate (Ap4A) HIT family hydrolase